MTQTEHRLQISVPGKTFLVGEYIALSGGPTIVVTTRPEFLFSIPLNAPDSDSYLAASLAAIDSSKGLLTSSLFHPESPAGRLMSEITQPNISQSWQQNFLRLDWSHAEFHDAYQSKGGMGASTAQYIAILMLDEMCQENWRDLQFQTGRLQQILQRYRRHSSVPGKGSAPSGADLIAQLVGGLVIWKEGKSELETLSQWPFPNLGFTLIRTGQKLATHTHLQSAMDVPIESLREIAASAVEAVSKADESLFCQSIQKYGDLLKASGLQSARSMEIVEQIRAEPRLVAGNTILAAKGCGAMGADIVLLVHRKTARSLLTNWLIEGGFEIVASEHELAQGTRLVN